MISMNPMISMISKIPQSYFDKFEALKRLLGPFFKNIGPFPKNVGLFPKNVGLFLRKSPTFFVLSPCFFVLELRWNNPLVWRLWKQKVQNPCNVRAWYAHARRLVGKGSRFSSVVSYDCYERLILCFFWKAEIANELKRKKFCHFFVDFSLFCPLSIHIW